ncbi:MAG: MATE family efflux transporter [Clostridiaceae bacterium]|nr:MATE family efflux transporter [Clostridiaceae bacterium]
MFNKIDFYKDIKIIAVPITLQSLFQSSVSVIDEIMVGQLGSTSIAGVGLGGKFSSLFSVTAAAIAAGAGILISQYYGSKNSKKVNDSFISHIYFSLILGIIFTLASLFFSKNIMSLYCDDLPTINAAASYLKIVAISFIPMTLTLIISTLLRCMSYAKYPMYSSIMSVVINTILNYFLIFGISFFPKMGLEGAAIATVISRLCEFILIFIFFIKVKIKENIYISLKINLTRNFIKQILMILCPILICEFLWSLGENIYTMIYGNIGTDACAAMTLTVPLQCLLTGAFSGISAAAGIMAGKALGRNDYDNAYMLSKKLFELGIILSILLGIILSLCASLYVKIFPIEDSIKQDTIYIIYAFSAVLFAKISNMILGGGTLRSGGNTKLVMLIDIIGTWLFGIPLGLLCAFKLNLPIYEVYFILSLEEVVRLLISLIIFKKRLWMKNLTKENTLEV